MEIRDIKDITPKNPEQEMALKNCIGLFITGSHLYGTNTPASDHDYEGIFINDPNYSIGTLSCDEVNFSTGDPNKKNTAEDIDCKLYSLKKYFQLAQQNNPNKVEYFFVPEEKFVYKNSKYWDKMFDNKNLFLSLKVKHSFTGYAHSQEYKLTTKKKRLDELKSFYKTLKEAVGSGHLTVGDMVEKMGLVEIHEHKKYHKETDKLGVHKVKRMAKKYDYVSYKMTQEGTDSIVVDNKEYNYGMRTEKIYSYVKEEIEKYGQRTKYIAEHGYDLKFAAHLFRLYYEGLRLLETGELIFPMPENERKFMMEIKNGDYDLDYLLSRSKEFKPLLDKAYNDNKANLAYSPNQEEIHKLLVDMTLDFWKETKEI
jgi:predicted nucleotidyltransferase